MPSVDLHALIAKLSSELSVSLESAAALAMRHSHETVELGHWLISLMKIDGFNALVAESGGDVAKIEAQARASVEAAPRGRCGAPAMSQAVITLAREGWVTTSLQLGVVRVTPEALLLTLVTDTELRAVLRGTAPAMLQLSQGVIEDAARHAAPAADADRVGQPAPSAGGEDFLAQFATDLTEEARQGRVDRIIGRDAELRQMIDILIRRRQNNPILVGEAGVGKTAIAEAFALAIAEGDIPARLSDVTLYVLDMNLLQAGAGVKGEFERRLKGLVDQVKASDRPIILFIDEAHMMIGAGGSAGQGDAANILKPALARGELRTIAATTWAEYKKYFEKDPALTRRFQTVKVDEPDTETAIRMMRAIAPTFRDHHDVIIRDGALRAAVELSERFLPERQLPDKAVSLIDTAAAAVSMSRETTPEALNQRLREAESLQAEIDALALEPLTKGLPARLKSLKSDLAQAQSEARALEQRLARQRDLAAAADAVEAEEGEDTRKRLAQAERALAKEAGETPLVHRVVDAEAVASVVGRWTGVPTGRLMRSEIAAVSSLADRLKQRVLGQDTTIDALADAMKVARADLRDPRRPQGVFLMVGTSGVGKTETALALADELYGGPQALTVINMSEFKEEHKVSLLMGSPPGYVGYGEGGVLTEAVRRRPYSVLLLDEMDKAHPGVQEIFYQVFDKGTLRDGEGRDVDFRNTTIIMTANTGTATLADLAEDPDAMPEGDALADMLRPELADVFKPAFLGRLSLLPYLPLDRAVLAGIVDLQLARVADRLDESYGAALKPTPSARQVLIDRAETGDAGARAIEALIARDLMPKLADYFLESLARGKTPRSVVVDTDADGGFVISASTPNRRSVS
ncbi:type VI secretion system ATPase TssH [Ruegeria jejuensis]|uniref:type VI secretion system ATPase TssH n=1 Tax=Ruegeria jejuensis TaxID=3233338 RepID=UPI00355AF873